MRHGRTGAQRSSPEVPHDGLRHRIQLTDTDAAARSAGRPQSTAPPAPHKDHFWSSAMRPLASAGMTSSGPRQVAALRMSKAALVSALPLTRLRANRSFGDTHPTMSAAQGCQPERNRRAIVQSPSERRDARPMWRFDSTRMPGGRSCGVGSGMRCSREDRCANCISNMPRS